MTDYINEVVSMLYDFAILTGDYAYNKDEREPIVREWLATYKTETAIYNAVRDLIIGNKTLNDALKQKGYLE